MYFQKYIDEFREIRESLKSDLAHYESNKKNCTVPYIRKEYSEIMARTQNQIKRLDARIGELEVHQLTLERMDEHDEQYQK